MENTKTNFEIDLEEGMKDPAKAKEVVRAVQMTIDQLVVASTTSLEEAKKAANLNEEYAKQVETLTKASIELTGALTDIHSLLGSKKDLWKEDAQMKACMDGLSVFIMGSGTIKLGILRNESGKSEEE